MPNTKMTDRLIKKLYFQIGEHYTDCCAQGMSLDETYYELYTTLTNSIRGSNNPYCELELSEQRKAYTVLETFLAASPLYQQKRPKNPATFFNHGEDIAPPRATRTTVCITREYYQNDSDLVLTWLMLDSINRPYYQIPSGHGHGVHFHPATFSGGVSSAGNRPNNNSKSDTNQAFAILAVLAIAATAFLLTAFAVYYLWAQLTKSAERFLYNEGWLKASLTLLGAIAGGMAAALFTETFLSASLISLALVAGFNPVGLVLGVAICLTLLGAAIGLLITNLIQDKWITAMNQEALDANDPYLFTLTDSEARRLSEGRMINGKMVYIDPVKVKCVIIAIRARMGEPEDRTNWNRFFDNRTDLYQAGLDQIRQLRRGVNSRGEPDDMSEIVVGNMRFDCTMSRSREPAPAPVYIPASPAYPAPPSYDDSIQSTLTKQRPTACDDDRDNNSNRSTVYSSVVQPGSGLFVAPVNNVNEGAQENKPSAPNWDLYANTHSENKQTPDTPSIS